MKKKICIICFQEKIITNFRRSKRFSDGYFPQCKECRKTLNVYKEPGKIKYLQDLRAQGKSRCSVCREIKDISGFKENSTMCLVCSPIVAKEWRRKKKEENPNWKQSRRELLPWEKTFKSARYQRKNGIEVLMSKEDFKEIWFRDSADKMKSPYIMRINTDKGFLIDNCKYVEKEEFFKSRELPEEVVLERERKKKEEKDLRAIERARIREEKRQERIANKPLTQYEIAQELLKQNKKRCSTCKEIKDISEFYKDKKSSTGLSSQCRYCHGSWSRKYPWKKRYNVLRYRCANETSYIEKGIKVLLTRDDIKTLWFRDKAYEMKEPVIHREKDNEHYTIENCKFLERKDHDDLHVKLRKK